MKKKISIKEIAKIANTSPTTVSFVLNNRKGVSEITRKRVLAIIDGLGYTPNLIARSLVTNKTTNLGLIISDISDPFFSDLARGVEDEAFRNGYSVTLCNTDNDKDKEMMYLQLLLSQNVAGLLLVPSSNNDEFEKFYLDLKTPIVFVDRYPKAIKSFSSVTSNNIQGAMTAVKYLIELGHERIGCVAMHPDWSTSIERVQGYKNVLAENSIEIDENLIIFTEGTLKSGKSVVSRLYALKETPSALFVASDIVAFGVVDSLLKHGFKIPEDISIIGFDNTQFSAQNIVPLTTINQPKYKIGKKACSLLLSKINDKDTLDTNIELDTNLIIRNSTSPKRKLEKENNFGGDE